MIHGGFMFKNRGLHILLYKRSSEAKRRFSSLKKSFLLIAILLISSPLHAMCPATTPWSTPVNVSNSGTVTSNIFSAATSAGFMAVWADSSNNAHYSFSSNGMAWQSGLVSSAQGDVASSSDVFVAGNATGFVVTWMDSSNNAWSSFSTDNGMTWSTALQINSTLPLDPNSDAYISGGSSGFVATMIGSDENAYVSFSTGTMAWSAPTQVTSDGSVYNENWNSQTTRGFVGAAVVGNSCMVTWITNTYAISSAYFTAINPFSSTTVYSIMAVGFFESVPIVAALNGYFMAATRANEGSSGLTIFSTATTPSNWAVFSLLSSTFINPNAGPWVAANHAGFMSTWVTGGSPGSPIWTFSTNNGFNWTPVCSILATVSTTIGGPVGLSANDQGFVATWLDGNDSNAYASFYATPPSNAASNIFVTLLQQKYGPLL